MQPIVESQLVESQLVESQLVENQFEGEFFTPLRFGKKAIHYWKQVLGKNWFKTGKYRIWDMAAGTGNPEYHF